MSLLILTLCSGNMFRECPGNASVPSWVPEQACSRNVPWHCSRNVPQELSLELVERLIRRSTRERPSTTPLLIVKYPHHQSSVQNERKTNRSWALSARVSPERPKRREEIGRIRVGDVSFFENKDATSTAWTEADNRWLYPGGREEKKRSGGGTHNKLYCRGATNQPLREEAEDHRDGCLVTQIHRRKEEEDGGAI